MGHSSGGASVFTVDLRAFQHPHCQLAGSLRPADGFPALRLLRSLRPTRRSSTDDEPARHCPGRAAGRATPGGSHVHHEPIDEGDAQLYPDRLATSTPQPFLVASSPVCPSRLRSRPPRAHSGRARHTDPDPPGSSRLDAYGTSRAGSSRTPSRLACRTRAVWQCRRAPSLSGLLPTLPGVPRIRLSSASTRLLRQPSGKGLPPLLGHTGASWRTNKSSNRRSGSSIAHDAAWSGSAVPLTRPARRSGHSTSVFTGASSTLPVSSLRTRCRPSPGGRLSRPRTTTTAPPHPWPLGRRRANPPATWLARRRDGQGWFPRSLLHRSTGEVPNFAPAASPRLRRRPSSWPPGRRLHPAQEFARHQLGGRAPHSGPYPPDWSRCIA